MSALQRIRVPPSIEPPPPPGFPLIALVAPVIASLLMWAVTGSPMMLLFAALGPVIALGTVIDGRWQRRRRLRRDRGAEQQQRERLLAEIDAAHAAERAAAWAAHPGVEAVLRAVSHDARRWRSGALDELSLVLGSGTATSALQFEGEPDAALRQRAARLDGMPILADAGRGILITGPLPLARAMLRSLVLQLAQAVPPDAAGFRAGPAQQRWLRALPHPYLPHPSRSQPSIGDEAEIVELVDVDGASIARLAACSGVDAGSTLGLMVLVRIAPTAEGTARLHCTLDDDAAGRDASPFTPSLVSAATAALVATELNRLAENARRAGAALPERIALAELLPGPQSGPSGAGDGLAAVVGVSTDGPVSIDLVSEGPHALIAGATGTGKSELLTAWVLAMAAGRSTDRVTFLLVDFKGGAAFAPLHRLPHCVGVITDLEPAGADRALLSLTAELRRRERLLAELGLRSIDEAGDHLARLVVVIDEYAAMLSALPHLAPLIADLAARGRSLGIHLLLCTQRPTGSVHEAVLANTGLRISLRVIDAGDSRAVLGRPDAAQLPPELRGRALIGRSGAAVQFAHADPSSDIDRIIATTPTARREPHRPWVAPLPPRIAPAALPRASRGIAFGLLDRPEAQRHEVAVYDPAVDGNLLVVGGAGSGRSTALAMLAAADGRGATVLGGVEAVWDAVTSAARGEAPGSADSRPGLLLLDDIDAVLDRLDDEQRHRLLRRLTVIAGRPSAGGSVAGVSGAGQARPPMRLVLSARRIPSAMHPLLPLLESRLVLRVADRQEHLLAGGSGAHFDAEAWPGAGEWRGHRVQIAAADPGPSRAAVVPPPLFVPDAERDVAVITRTPGRTAELLGVHRGHELVASISGARERGIAVRVADHRPTITIADPEAWQLAWGELSAARLASEVLVHGLDESELRLLLRERIELPPFEPGADAAWRLSDEGPAQRVRLREA